MGLNPLQKAKSHSWDTFQESSGFFYSLFPVFLFCYSEGWFGFTFFWALEDLEVQEQASMIKEIIVCWL